MTGRKSPSSRGRNEPPAPTVRVTWEQVRAWRVARHHLSRQVPRGDMPAVVARLAGVQAQLMSSAVLSLWSRVEGLQPDDVPRALWEDRTLVKTWAMRGTLHLLPAAELRLWQAVPALDRRYLRPAWLRHYGVSAEELERLTAAISQSLHGRILTREELVAEVTRLLDSEHLGSKLRHGWGMMLKPAAFRAQLCFAPNAGQSVRFTHPESWLAPAPDVGVGEAERIVTRRFLGAHGPMPREGYGIWLGVPAARAGRLIAALGDEVTPVDIEGAPALALTESVEELLSARRERTVRLLPAFDQYVLVAARTPAGFLPGAFAGRIYRPQGWLSPVLLVNGRMDGVWRHERAGRRLKVQIEPFVPLPQWVRTAAEAEAERLVHFLGGTLELTWLDPS